MSSFFEYIYYRVCKVFFKWDGIDGNRAIWAVTMIQTLLICDFVLLLFILFEGRVALFPYSKIIGLSAVAILITLMILNSRIYDGRYNEFNEKWKDEPENSKILKGFFVMVMMFLPWIGLLLISKLN